MTDTAKAGNTIPRNAVFINALICTDSIRFLLITSLFLYKRMFISGSHNEVLNSVLCQKHSIEQSDGKGDDSVLVQ